MKIKVQPDLEKARSIIKIIESRKKFVETYKNKIYSTVICENYYEIIKELATALCLSRGFKFVGKYAHKELIEMTVNLVNLDESFLFFLDDLRQRRNGSLYYGEEFGDNYLVNNQKKFNEIIEKIEKELNNKIEGSDEK
ncbi:MAG: hypothetical protein KKF50_01455 [Nanoarchaeota archaeon]|nr:hypothetical protein [Nanoarchaeota archaeon]